MLLVFLLLWPIVIFLVTLFIIGLKTKKTGNERIYSFVTVDFVASIIAYTLAYLSGSLILADIAGNSFIFSTLEYFYIMPKFLLILFLGGFIILYFAAAIRTIFIKIK